MRACLLTGTVVIVLATTATGLSPNKKIERVAIIGSGISGLSVAHALPEETKVEIFDARPGLDHTAGAGFQLNGGLSVLDKINPDLQRKVREAGVPLVGVQSRCKSWFGKDSKKYSTLFNLDIQKIVTSSEAKELMKDDKLLWISIMRGALQKVLFENLSTTNVQFDKKMVNILPCSDGSGVTCEFADGTTAGPFDMVVGCDGTRSVVKDYVDKGKITASRPGDAIYSGIRIRYAVADGDETSASSNGSDGIKFSQYFGDGAYALHASYGNGVDQPNTRAAYLIYLDENFLGPFRIKPEGDARENADWQQDQRQPLEAARENMLQQLRDGNIPDQDGDLEAAIAGADRFFELGSYFHNPFKKWSRQVEGAHVVLCGDAAHSFPPFLGQGSNQAIQDAYCLVQKIKEYNSQVEQGDEEASLQKALGEYQTIRWAACFNIFWKSVFLGYLETGGRDGFYAKFRDAFFNILGLLGVPAKVLLSAAKPEVE